MAQVETMRGPVEVASLGLALMHEHVFILNEEIRRNYGTGWAEEAQITSAVTKLSALAARGCVTIADPTVLGPGRDIGEAGVKAAFLKCAIEDEGLSLPGDPH